MPALVCARPRFARADAGQRGGDGNLTGRRSPPVGTVRVRLEAEPESMPSAPVGGAFFGGTRELEGEVPLLW